MYLAVNWNIVDINFVIIGAKYIVYTNVTSTYRSRIYRLEYNHLVGIFIYQSISFRPKHLHQHRIYQLFGYRITTNNIQILQFYVLKFALTFLN